jgi:hypothetical protein
MIFEPSKTRNGFHEFLLNSMINASYDEDRPMGNVAHYQIADIVKAWLVGLNVEMAPVLPRALDWLDRAISQDEKFGTSRNFHRLTLHWARALGLWMLHGSSDPTAWNKVLHYCAAALQDGGVYPPNLVDKDRLDDYMAFSVLSGQYEIGIREFEKYWGVKTHPLKEARTPRQVGYMICLHRVRQRFDELELLNAGRKMLQGNLEKDWLGRGQTIRAATWLKIVYEHHHFPLSPLQTILRAYEDMPKVQCPDFLGT